MWQDGQFSCPWCELKCTNAQGIGAHASKKHPDFYRKMKQERGIAPRSRTTPVAGAVRTKKNDRPMIKGIDLRSVPTDQLPLVAAMAKQELKSRFEKMLSRF